MLKIRVTQERQSRRRRTMSTIQKNNSDVLNKTINVNQHAKMTPLGGKTASKIDPPLRCNITAG